MIAVSWAYVQGTHFQSRKFEQMFVGKDFIFYFLRECFEKL